MPYITKIARNALYDIPEIVKTPGELNYLFTYCIKSYIKNNKLSYQTINDIIGALEGAKLEFYRRIVVDYESKACEKNGDVY